MAKAAQAGHKRRRRITEAVSRPRKTAHGDDNSGDNVAIRPRATAEDDNNVEPLPDNEMADVTADRSTDAATPTSATLVGRERRQCAGGGSGGSRYSAEHARQAKEPQVFSL